MVLGTLLAPRQRARGLGYTARRLQPEYFLRRNPRRRSHPNPLRPSPWQRAVSVLGWSPLVTIEKYGDKDLHVGFLSGPAYEIYQVKRGEDTALLVEELDFFAGYYGH